MLDAYTLDSTLLDAPGGAAAATTADAIVFNDYGLQNTTIITQILRQDSTPTRELTRQDTPRANGRFIVGDFYREKTITLQGVVTKTTASLLEAELDAMKKALKKREGVLDITIDGVVRRYLATLVNGDKMFERRGTADITKVPFDLEFVTVEPFGKSVSYVSATYVDDTRLSFVEQIDNDGTTNALPVLILNFSAATSITAISFENTTRGEEIVLTQSISAGDYVKFDSENREVTVNGTVVDYSGSFPELDAGENSITVTLTGTSATYTLTAKHKTPYL